MFLRNRYPTLLAHSCNLSRVLCIPICYEKLVPFYDLLYTYCYLSCEVELQHRYAKKMAAFRASLAAFFRFSLHADEIF